MDAYMVLAHCPATGKSYAAEPSCGKYEDAVPAMMDRLLFALSWRKIDARGFVFDVLIRLAGAVAYLPHRELSYDEASAAATGSFVGKRA